MARSLLLISSNEKDEAFVKEVAAAADLPLKVVPNAEASAEYFARDEATVILADCATQALYQDLENTIQNTVGLFSDRINANAIHFLSDGVLENAQFLVQSPLFGHFIMRNYHDPVAAGRHYGKIVRATLEPRAFGLQQLLGPGAKIQVVPLQATTQKQNAVEAVKNFLVQAKFQTRMATVVANAVDELLMNAMFDAPIDDLGRPLFTSTSRSTAFKLESKHAVEMHVGFDGTYVAITAVDLFGSLDKNKLLSHISKIYTEEEYKVRTAVAGAGIGLATVFRSGGSFLFCSENRVRTEVTVMFRRCDSYREFKDQFRFLSTQFYF